MSSPILKKEDLANTFGAVVTSGGISLSIKEDVTDSLMGSTGTFGRRSVEQQGLDDIDGFVFAGIVLYSLKATVSWPSRIAQLLCDHTALLEGPGGEIQ